MNDPITEAANAVADSTSPGGAVPVGQIASMAGELKSKYQTGKEKKKVGRPRKSSIAPGMGDDTTKPETPVHSDAGFRVDKEIVERTVKAVVGSADNAVKRRVYTTGLAVGADKELAMQLAASASMSTEEQGLIGELTGIIFEKHGWLTGAAPEILLGAILVSYSTRVGVVLYRLKQIAAMNEEKSVAAKSSVNKSPDNG